MSSLIYTCIIITAGAITVVLQFKSNKLQKTNVKWYRRPTRSGWAMIIFSIIVAAFSIAKDFEADKKADRDKFVTDSTKKSVDSINIEINKSNTKETITSFTTALAKFGLRYDSTNKSIKVFLKDSINKANLPDPVLTLIGVSHTLKAVDTLLLTLKFLSQKSVSYGVNMKAYSFMRLNGKLVYIGTPDKPLFSNIEVGERTYALPDLWYNGVSKDPAIMVALIGSYYSKSRVRISFRTMMYYDYRTEFFGEVINPTKGKIISMLKKQGIKF